MSEDYDGPQFVGIDVHRRRSVLVRMSAAGEPLECVRFLNDPDRLAAVMAAAGEHPEVVLEATYGWYWAADQLAALGAHVHLAHPLGVKAFSYRRVKNDVRDATDWPTCYGWVGFRRPGLPHRRPGSCGSWSGIARNWCSYAPACAAKCCGVGRAGHPGRGQ